MPSCGPFKSRQTSKQPTLSPLPVRKLSTLSEQLEKLGGRIISLEYSVRHIREQDSLKAQSKQIEQLNEAMSQLWAFVCGNEAGKEVGMKNGHGNGKG